MSPLASDEPEAPPIVVIGAGPAGLNLAYELKRRGMATRVLEKAPAPGDSWNRMPRDMMLNSPAGVSVLADTRVGLREWGEVWNRQRFYDHLIEFHRSHGLEVECGVSVDRISRDPEGHFMLETSEGRFAARTIVNATGYFCNPFIPRRPGDEKTRILQLSVPEYRSPESIRERLPHEARRILIVGARITAGQLGVELHDAGFKVTISHHHPLEFGLDPRVQRLGFRVYYPYESVRLRSPSFARRDSGHPMQGGRARTLIESGQIETRPDLERFTEDGVRFVDGREAEFDAVLWATGYRPVLAHLAELVTLDEGSGLPKLDQMESVDTPGLFFLGLDQQKDFTSRMLRGIRRDAGWLAERLARRLRARSDKQ